MRPLLPRLGGKFARPEHKWLERNTIVEQDRWGYKRERERENFICKAGTPEGQPPIYAGAYVTVHNNAHIEKTSKKQTMCILSQKATVIQYLVEVTTSNQQGQILLKIISS